MSTSRRSIPVSFAGRETTWLERITSPIGLTGVYLWSLTCLPVFESLSSLRGSRGAAESDSSWWAVGVASVSLACLVAGVALQRSRPAAAVFFGVWGFLGGACGAWLLHPAVVDVTHLDPFRGVFASIGCCLYALAWGVPRVLSPHHPEQDPRAHPTVPLAPRGETSRSAVLVVALGVGSCLAWTILAWRIREPTRALVAHAVTGLASVCFLSAAGFVAVRRPPMGRRAVGDRLRYVLRAWAVLFGILVAGLVVDTWLRR